MQRRRDISRTTDKNRVRPLLVFTISIRTSGESKGASLANEAGPQVKLCSTQRSLTQSARRRDRARRAKR